MRAQLIELIADRCISVAERRVGEHGLHQVLAVVERALDRDVADIRGQHGGHLPALHRAGPVVRVQDHDVDPLAPGAGLDGRRPGVARGRADDRHPRVALRQHMVEQPAQHLHRHVLEGERGAVEQFLDEQAGFELHQRHDGGVAEAGIGIMADRGQHLDGIDVPTNGCITRAASAVVGQAAHRAPVGRRKCGQVSGTNSPPSSARPASRTPAKSRAGACPRVEM